MKAILVPKMKLNTLSTKVIERPLKKYAGLAARQMEGTTVNFRVVSPNFQSSFDFDGGMAFVGPTNEPDGMIWFYLERGTEVRYAIMNPGYSPGTTPNSLSTTTAEGSKAYVDTSKPQPGIDPRLWTDLIVNDLGPKFSKDVSTNLVSFTKGIFG